MRKLNAMPSQCWICRTPVDGLEDAVMDSLLLHLKLRSRVRGCSRQCEEVQSDSGVVFARFYRLACHHYCGDHIDHRCCRCRATKSSTTHPEPLKRPRGLGTVAVARTPHRRVNVTCDLTAFVNGHRTL
jgi:hypothetical protein